MLFSVVSDSMLSVSLPSFVQSLNRAKIPLSPLFPVSSETSQKRVFQAPLTPFLSASACHFFTIFRTLKKISPPFSTNSEKHRGRHPPISCRAFHLKVQSRSLPTSGPPPLPLLPLLTLPSQPPLLPPLSATILSIHLQRGIS